MMRTCTNALLRLLASILVLITVTGLLAGCSTQAAAPPVTEQSRDLMDDDADGVINARDKCPGTPHSAIVDNDGCPRLVERSESSDLHILFANDSTVIPTNFLGQIKRMADFLANYPEARIELKGYASPVGASDYNLGLSQRRAKVVRQQLIEFGVSPNRIKTLGFGDTVPVAANTREQSNTLSRRVTARVRGERGNVLEEWTIFSLRAD
ncbi:putative outer membrane protein [Photobacterium gaetbulicola Gung47]|uniref:Putative outer membrane protein n=2 Tax=Photobacterium gaetbulicola TaxID=1295392 RepID=A0A0C5WMV9_9GAMM|nr:OmpA family protein [Photobacterium gaetbulicola]AJR06409.1 putative outer membrane protein [Photobacterium gaetbulicola Gung47]